MKKKKKSSKAKSPRCSPSSYQPTNQSDNLQVKPARLYEQNQLWFLNKSPFSEVGQWNPDTVNRGEKLMFNNYTQLRYKLF